jgi:hypothetical protein
MTRELIDDEDVICIFDSGSETIARPRFGLDSGSGPGVEWRRLFCGWSAPLIEVFASHANCSSAVSVLKAAK